MSLKFLADESCDFSIVRMLRTNGYDVVAVCETIPGAPDAKVLQLATASGRLLLTEDRDFGELVYSHLLQHGGIILVRYPVTLRKDMPSVILALIQQKGDELDGCFVVITPAKIRIRRKWHMLPLQ